MKVWKKNKSTSTRKENQRWLRDLKLIEWGPRGLFSEYLEMGKRLRNSGKISSNENVIRFISSTIWFRDDIRSRISIGTVLCIA